MTCKEFASSITEYLENALQPRECADFEQHMAGCANCQTYFEQMNQLIRAALALRQEPDEIKVPPRLYGLLTEDRRRASLQNQSRGLAYWPFVTGGVAIAILAGLWLYRTHKFPKLSTVVVTIDLTQRGPTRGIGQPPRQPIELPRAKLNLTVEMPIGAMPGKYEVAVAPEHGSPSITARGTAALVNHVTTLHVTLDLTKFRGGSYRFGVRPVSWEWVYYPLRIE